MRALNHRPLVSATGNAENSAFMIVGSDPFLFANASYFVHSAEHGEQQKTCRFFAVTGFQRRRRHRKARRAPATIPPRSAETDYLSFQDRHTQIGIRAQQVVRGPKAGVAGTKNSDVHLCRFRQRRARREVLSAGLKPETVFGVVGHRSAALARTYSEASGRPRDTSIAPEGLAFAGIRAKRPSPAQIARAIHSYKVKWPGTMGRTLTRTIASVTRTPKAAAARSKAAGFIKKYEAQADIQPTAQATAPTSRMGTSPASPRKIARTVAAPTVRMARVGVWLTACTVPIFGSNN